MESPKIFGIVGKGESRSMSEAPAGKHPAGKGPSSIEKGQDSEFADWIGRRETVREIAAVEAAAGMIATLDRDEAPPRPGDPLPPLRHWMFFNPKVRPGEIGPDGHPKRGLFLPPVPLPRRMFAGARVSFHAAIGLGEEMTRESEITDIVRKTGRSGELVFVTIRHRVSAAAGLAIEEEQDIVYRDVAGPAMTPTAVAAERENFDWRRTITPDPVMLFRYSALTFNGHRIHYDRPYVTGVEGYPGLVVHGPLTATLLLDLARDSIGRPVKSFAFQGKRPLFDTAPFEIMGRMNRTEDGGDGNSCTVWAADPDGNVAMTASVEFGEG